MWHFYREKVILGGGVFSFWSGEGAFFGVGDLFFFYHWGGGSPLVGGKKGLYGRAVCPAGHK